MITTLLGRLALVTVLAVGTPSFAQGPPGGTPGGGNGGGGNGGGGGKKADHKSQQTPPIKQGTSGGNLEDDGPNGACASGALGALLQDSAPTPNYFFLSASHVLAHDVLSPGANSDVADIGDAIIQPGLVDVDCDNVIPFDAEIVGTLQSLSSLVAATVNLDNALRPFATNNVDVAVAQVGLCGGVLCAMDNGSILGIGIPSSIIVLENTLQAGQPVMKSGRTTGVTKSTIDSLNATFNVEYTEEADPNGGTYWRRFTELVVVKNRRDKFVTGGDSGSVLLTDDGTKRPIGVLFGGGGGIAVANTVERVLAYLDSGVVYGVAMEPFSFVGDAISGSSTAQPASLTRAISVQEANASGLSAVSGGVGHAVSLQNGVGIIKVFVEEITPEVRQDVPNQINGVPVVLEAVGRIVAY